MLPVPANPKSPHKGEKKVRKTGGKTREKRGKKMQKKGIAKALLALMFGLLKILI